MCAPADMRRYRGLRKFGSTCGKHAQVRASGCALNSWHVAAAPLLAVLGAALHVLAPNSSHLEASACTSGVAHAPGMGAVPSTRAISSACSMAQRRMHVSHAMYPYGKIGGVGGSFGGTAAENEQSREAYTIVPHIGDRQDGRCVVGTC